MQSVILDSVNSLIQHKLTLLAKIGSMILTILGFLERIIEQKHNAQFYEHDSLKPSKHYYTGTEQGDWTHIDKLQVEIEHLYIRSLSNNYIHSHSMTIQLIEVAVLL